MELATAGHPPPLLLRGGASEPLRLRVRPLLGVAHGEASTHELTMEPDDILVVYTDGIVERRDVEIDESIRHLARSAAAFDHAGTLDAWIENLLTAVPGTLDDDLTIAAIRRTPTTRPREQQT